MRWRIAFGMTALHAALVAAAAVLVAIAGDFSLEPAVDYARTPPMVGYIMFCLAHLPHYLATCAGLSAVAACHFWRRAAGREDRAFGTVYVSLKGLLTASVLCFVVFVLLLLASDVEQTRLHHTDGTSSYFAVESVGWVVPVLAEVFLSLPLLLMIVLRLWPAARER